MPLAGTVTPASLSMSVPAPPITPLAAPPTAAPISPPSGQHRPVSATLAVNEAMAARRRRGQPVLPLGFGEAGAAPPPAPPRAPAAAAARSTHGAHGRPQAR